MKNLLLILPLTLLSVPVQAQQTNVYQVCKTYQESYAPGYYDGSGNYIRGRVVTTGYNTPCGSANGNVAYSQPIQRQQPCPTATLGTVIGAYAVYKNTKRVSDRWWQVPLGALGGNAVGRRLCN